METKELLFALIRSAMSHAQPEAEMKAGCTPEKLAEICALAEKHSLGHMVSIGATQWDLPESPQAAECKKLAMLAFFRYTVQDRMYKQTCKILEEAQIPHIPLKGTVLRDLYPEPWMRTSCDVDILIPKDRLNQAVSCLGEACSYQVKCRTAHDVSLFTPNNIHLELHFDLVESGRAVQANEILESVWKHVKCRGDKQYLYTMTDDYFYFYHIAHMAKHFECGGCGIRPFIDLWLMNRQNKTDFTARKKLLRQGGLEKFAEAVGYLSRVWMEDAPHTRLSQQMENYILKGGSYGNMENYILLQQQKNGSAGKYALFRMFPPYDIMKRLYPCLENRKWLVPFFYPVRWVRRLVDNRGKQAMRELRYSKNIVRELGDIQNFIREIGL